MDDLNEQALAEIEIPVKMYLAELGYLMEAKTPEKIETFELTAQNRLEKLRQAMSEARQKFEIPLTDEQVITYGIKALGQTHAVLKACCIKGRFLATRSTVSRDFRSNLKSYSRKWTRNSSWFVS